jgi:hypothetical protein
MHSSILTELSWEHELMNPCLSVIWAPSVRLAEGKADADLLRDKNIVPWMKSSSDKFKRTDQAEYVMFFVLLHCEFVIPLPV